MTLGTLEWNLSPNSLQEWLKQNEPQLRDPLSGREKWIRNVLYPQSGSIQLADLTIITLRSIFTKLLPGFPLLQNGGVQDLDQTNLSQVADLLQFAKLMPN